jgi:hypothetical protein
MKRSQRALFLTAALFTGVAVTEAQRTIRTHASPTGTNSFFGRAVEGIGDVDGDGRADYAVSGNAVSLGGNGAGAVQAFSGATGALLWTANGFGGWVPCGGGGGTTGDFFGFDIELVPDVDGDGRDDLAVGAPFTGIPNGACFIPNVGRVTVLSSVTGLPIPGQTTSGNVFDDNYGMMIKRIPDMLFDGIDEYLVRSPRFVNVIDGATGTVFNTLPLGSGDLAISGVGDFNQDGLAWEIAIGNPGAGTVTIIDTFLGTTKVFNGPAGSQFGAALELVRKDDAGLPGVLVGAPNEAGGAGAVYLIDQNGVVRISLGTAGSQLGSALAFGGNADLDGMPDDVLAGAPGNATVRLMTLSGTLIQDVAGTSTANFGQSVDWVGTIVPNGFDEFVVGVPAFTTNTGRAEVLFGGPATTLNQNFGPGCNPLGGGVPSLTQSAGLRPGGSYTCTLTGAPPFTTGILALGPASTVGVPFGPCRIWMGTSFGPITQATVFTNFIGTWTSPTLTIPLDPNLVGLDIAHQAGVSLSGAFILSNATESRIGW